MYLDQVTSVTFGGTFAKSFKIIDHTTIKAVVGSGNTGILLSKQSMEPQPPDQGLYTNSTSGHYFVYLLLPERGICHH